MSGLDEWQRLAALLVRMHLGVGGQVDTEVRSPGGDDVAIAVRDGEAVSYQEVTVGQQQVVQRLVLGLQALDEERLDLVRQAGGKERP